MKESKNNLLLILLIGFIIRLIGVSHSFPLILHPDEPTIIRSALSVRFDTNIGHFDWPHLYIYINYFMYMLFAKIRDFITVFGYKDYVYPMIYDDNLIFYALTRILSTVFGTLTIIPIYFSSKLIFNKKIATLVSLIFTFIPLHVWYSQYALTEAPLVFFVSLTLYFSLRILYFGKLSDYIWAGIFSGLAFSTKYNGGLSVIFVVLAFIIRYMSWKESKLFSKRLFYPIISSILFFTFFFVGTPFAILDYSTFVRDDSPVGAFWQFKNVGKVSWSSHLSQFGKSLTFGVIDDLGYSLIIMFWITTALVLIFKRKEFSVRNRPDFILLLLSSVFYFYYISGFEKDRSHYFLIAYPSFVIYSSGYIFEYLNQKKIKSPLYYLLFLLIFIMPVSTTVMNTIKRVKKDTRVLLYNYINSNSNISFLFNDSEYKSIFNYKLTPSQRVYEVNTALITDYDKKLVYTISNRLRQGPNFYIYEKLE